MLTIYNLIIEVTRKCNMTCDHCLRGDAVNINMKEEYIDSLLSQINSIGTVTFSGGEPSLNVPIMEYFLSECKRRNVEVGSFYIATNGVEINPDFLVFCIKMYAYCAEKDCCRVDVSNDMYHAAENSYDDSLLSALTFFGTKFSENNFNYYNGKSLLIQGRNENGSEVEERVFEDIDEFDSDCQVYLNCLGQIINGCDWSYENQHKHKLCDVNSLMEFHENMFEFAVVSK